VVEYLPGKHKALNSNPKTAKKKKKKIEQSWMWWLSLVIPAGMPVQSQPELLEALSQKKNSEPVIS
jgi:hypothetical protein